MFSLPLPPSLHPSFSSRLAVVISCHLSFFLPSHLFLYPSIPSFLPSVHRRTRTLLPVRSERACVRDHKNPLISGKNRRRASYWSAGGVRVDGAALALRHPTTVQRGPRRRVLVSALGRGERRPYVGFGDGTFLLRHTRGEGNYSSDGGGRK